jgi:methylated-DNA-protein-cysteine methyltransferase-like protein
MRATKETRNAPQGRRGGKHAPKALTPFQRAVARVVKGIPRGITLAYSEVALRVGRPRGARQVVRALHALDDVPWWRVARADGTLAPQVAREQEQLLRSEGWRGHRKPSERRKPSGQRTANKPPRPRNASAGVARAAERTSLAKSAHAKREKRRASV